MTKICIYGAGAIGGYLASALDQAGTEVSLVARGPHLKAIQEKGLRFEKDGQIFTHHLPVSENPNANIARRIVQLFRFSRFSTTIAE